MVQISADVVGYTIARDEVPDQHACAGRSILRVH